MSEKINLRMAKPNAGDMQVAKDLARAFSEIAEGYMPTLIDDDSDERLGVDPGKIREAFYRLCEIAQRGSLDRVVWTLDMLLNPKNAVIDPDSDHVALHPRFAVADDLLEVLMAYEQWEADIIIDGDWSH